MQVRGDHQVNLVQATYADEMTGESNDRRVASAATLAMSEKDALHVCHSNAISSEISSSEQEVTVNALPSVCSRPRLHRKSCVPQGVNLSRSPLSRAELAACTRTSEHETSDEDECGELRVPAGQGVRGVGVPLSVHIGGRYKPFADGAGLCSPGNWAPEQRREQHSWLRREWLLMSMKQLLHKQMNVKKIVCELAAGRWSESPFNPALLEAGRALLAQSLVNHLESEPLRKQPEHSMYLRPIGLVLREAGDPDWRVYETGKRNFNDGVPIGHREPLPRTPSVYRRKVQWRAYDDDKVHWNTVGNYGDTDKRSTVIEAQFVEERRLGMMHDMPLAEAQAKYGDRLRIASLGSIAKSDDSIRVLHDGTHGVWINPEIRPRDQVEVPGVGEEKVVMQHLSARGVSAFGLVADVAKAHRRFRVLERDWGMVACRLRSDTVWLNEVGTFGIGSSNYWFSRLIGGQLGLS